MLRISSSTMLLLVAGLAAACGSKTTVASDSNTRAVTGLSHCSVLVPGYYYLGGLFNYTGSQTGGHVFDAGPLAAVKTINAAGGVKGKPVGLITCDSAGDPGVLASAIAELKGATPTISGGIIAAAGAGLSPIVASLATSPTPWFDWWGFSADPNLTAAQQTGHFYSVVNIDTGVAIAQDALAQGYHRAFVAYLQRYGEAASQSFVQSFSAGGGTAQAEGYDPGTPGYQDTIVAAAQAYQPDIIVLLATLDDALAIVSTAISSNLAPSKWYFNYMMAGAFASQVHNDAYLAGARMINPSAFGSSAYQTNPSIQPYMALFQAATDGPSRGLIEAPGFDAAFVLAASMQLASDPQNGSAVNANIAKVTAASGTAIGPADWATFLQHANDAEYSYQGASGQFRFVNNISSTPTFVVSTYVAPRWIPDHCVVAATGAVAPCQ